MLFQWSLSKSRQRTCCGLRITLSQKCIYLTLPKCSYLLHKHYKINWSSTKSGRLVQFFVAFTSNDQKFTVDNFKMPCSQTQLTKYHKSSPPVWDGLNRCRCILNKCSRHPPRNCKEINEALSETEAARSSMFWLNMVVVHASLIRFLEIYLISWAKALLPVTASNQQAKQGNSCESTSEHFCTWRHNLSQLSWELLRVLISLYVCNLNPLMDIHLNDGDSWWTIRQKLYNFNQNFLPSQISNIFALSTTLVSCSNVKVAYQPMKANCVPTINVYRYLTIVSVEDSAKELLLLPFKDQCI